MVPRSTGIMRNASVGLILIAALALSSHFVARTLSDAASASELSMRDASDRSVFAPAAYGMDSQTAVDDDEDMLQSIKHLEHQNQHSIPFSNSALSGHRADASTNSIPPAILQAFQRARQKYNADDWHGSDEGGVQTSVASSIKASPQSKPSLLESSSGDNTADTTLQALQRKVQVLQEEVHLKKQIAALQDELHSSDSEQMDVNTPVIRRSRTDLTQSNTLHDDRTADVQDSQNTKGPGQTADFVIHRGRRDSSGQDLPQGRQAVDALHAALMRKLQEEMAGLQAVKASYAASMDTSDVGAAQAAVADGPTTRSKLSFAAQERDLRWVRQRQVQAQLSSGGAQVPECLQPECLRLAGGSASETATPKGGGISLTRIKGVGADKCYYLSILGDVGHKMSVSLEGSDGYKREWTGYGQVYSGCVDKRPDTTDTLLATDEINGEQQAFQWTSDSS